MRVGLSELLRFKIADTRGQKVPLHDLASIISEDYPAVTGRLWQQKKESFFLASAAVISFDVVARQITVCDLQESSPASKAAPGEAFLSSFCAAIRKRHKTEPDTAVPLFVLFLINDVNLTGELKNTRFYNYLGWGTFALVVTAAVLMYGTQILNL